MHKKSTHQYDRFERAANDEKETTKGFKKHGKGNDRLDL